MRESHARGSTHRCSDAHRFGGGYGCGASAETGSALLFYNQFDGWRAADATTLFIRADVDRYYRIDLAQECAALTAPDAQLILNVHGSSMICSAVGISVKVTQPFAGIPELCFVKAMTELSPAEVAVIPKKLRP